MSDKNRQVFDPFGDRYHDRLTECLEEFGGRDAKYYNTLKSKWLLKLARERLGDLSKIRFLDVGCGTGLTEEAVASNFQHGYGADLSMGMLKARVCRKSNCLFMKGDATRLPFPDHFIDLAFSVTLMHHLPDEALEGMFRELKRVLKPGGLTIHFDHNPKNFMTRRVVDSCEYDKGTTLRPVETMKKVVEANGFTFKDKGYLVFFPASMKFLEPVERAISFIPFGAQYFFSASPA